MFISLFFKTCSKTGFIQKYMGLWGATTLSSSRHYCLFFLFVFFFFKENQNGEVRVLPKKDVHTGYC